MEDRNDLSSYECKSNRSETSIDSLWVGLGTSGIALYLTSCPFVSAIMLDVQNGEVYQQPTSKCGLTTGMYAKPLTAHLSRWTHSNDRTSAFSISISVSLCISKSKSFSSRARKLFHCGNTAVKYNDEHPPPARGTVPVP